LLPPYRYEGSKPVTRKVAYTREKEKKLRLDSKDNIRCSLVVLDTTEVFYNNLNTNTKTIKN
jgi:hypothetical protein